MITLIKTLNVNTKNPKMHLWYNSSRKLAKKNAFFS